ncbi:hypothetical protein PPERSA_00521 [Pseudocohnilembus persalinus]|uniref:Opioid growth factor receptor (OGFr) conserved domain-containing protein n=1 Tax=Pseudocohnilembus persalinus TaxID=266149 RepID=A0A0V0QHP7_PSEPJ|nr:hypothetical protein PPERSA_00521 [Pseudocohnilembus persalinus]|eukprot:KRX01811.1 hypothetical protein PPERSA_00521 [Pseudocohnilembus persalinus]
MEEQQNKPQKLNLITNYFNIRSGNTEQLPEKAINKIQEVQNKIYKKTEEIDDEDISHQTTSISDNEYENINNQQEQKNQIQTKSVIVKKQINQESDKNYDNQEDDDEKNKFKKQQILTASEKIEKIKKQETFYNYLFYSNKIQSFPNGNYINSIHEKWAKNYELLERHHGYVQWLFPNHYSSRFNSNAHKLLKEEAQLFKRDLQIAKRQVKSFKMFLDFLGIQIVNLETGQMARTKHYKERFQKTLLTSWHNHMRVTRLLAHFSVTGFRRYAEKLIEFLETEIYGQLSYLKNPRIPINGSIAGMKDLAKHTRIFREWSTYAKIPSQNQEIQIKKLEENCFESYKVIQEESIFFEQFKTKSENQSEFQQENKSENNKENKPDQLQKEEKQSQNNNQNQNQQIKKHIEINTEEHDLF